MSTEIYEWNEAEFVVLPYEHDWPESPGVYVFAAPSFFGRWSAIYIGETGDLADRIPNHEMWPRARALGATKVHARIVPSIFGRILLEDSLITLHDPPLNTRGK